MSSNDEHEDGGERKRRGIILGMGIPDEIRDMLEGGASMFSGSITEGAPVKDYVRSLVSMASMMDSAPDYAVNDIVRFKPGLNHTRLTDEMIVREILSEPVRASDETSFAGYCDMQTVKVGVIVKNGHYHEFMIDGRRIEKADQV